MAVMNAQKTAQVVSYPR
uniref:Uncharacterized protein n=1 Tax=Anguilla anguilla TaxID=7936 RepID=A0A0E9RSK8_ANGAN